MLDISQLACGKWRGILSAAGIEQRFLTGRHTACPVCGGKDRFRFDDKEGMGTWYCNNCKAGDGFKLVMNVLHVDFKEAAKIVKEKIGVADYVEPKKQQNEEQNKASLNAIYKQSEPVTAGDFVDKYLASRNIAARPKALRKIHKCRSSSGKLYPAMLAIMSDLSGKSVTMHRTYIVDGKKADIEKPREFMPGKIPDGAAVRLCEPGINLGIAEGVETALSASQLYNIPVWAALNAVLLEKWTPPAESTNIFIFADNDFSFTGQKAAYALANRLSLKGLSVQVIMPDKIGTDWNDVGAVA
jgi:putative DNA primase/helicase